MSGLAGRRVLVVSRRDVRHPQAGNPEWYLHEIARHWVAGGARVTWVVTRQPGLVAREWIDGVEVLRSQELRGTYPRAALRMLRRGERFDAVVDATGRASRTPLIAGRRTPVVQVVHQVRPRARRNKGDHAIAALSPSSRHELRRNLGLRGPIFVVPPGAPVTEGTGERAADPMIIVVAPLVPEQRLDLFLHELAPVVERVPRLRVEIIGDGPEFPRLRRIVHDAGVAAAVSLHGRLPGAERDVLLRRAWLTVSAATGEVCGRPVLEAAAHGVPCVALDALGVRDFIRNGRTGQIVDSPDRLGQELVRQLGILADEEHARAAAERCRAWAGHFRWERSARLLAGVVEHQIGAARHQVRRRQARSDIATLVRLPEGVRIPAGALRVTDEVAEAGGVVSVLLNGCDEVGAQSVLDRLGVEDATVRLACHEDLLTGPHTTELRTPAHERG